MRIAIIGAGGVGLYLSHRLLGAGHEVVLRGRERTAGALGAAPLTLVSASGRAEPITAPRVVTALDTREFVAAFDLVILATKAWQVSAAAAELPGSLTPTGRVLTTQNGVDAPARVAEHLPAEHVLGGALVVIAERLDPSTVRLIGAEGSLALGS
ncbi:ketopantoate reductase family protein, partial [Leucobacter sp. M11]|uniref:ketopantoate reductase family protein n=1 Tax=Leucobacter sp. M11 TaxID=2993565 RepID=UPI002D7F88D4